MHKLTKTFLRLWISIASVLAFTFGWAFLAHAQKPAPLVIPQVQIFSPKQSILDSVPTLNDYLTKGTRAAPVVQNPSVTFPRLRTRGS
jgi:hypothetical protein